MSGETTLVARGTTSAAVGDLAHHIGVRLHELHPVTASLEQAYMELTAQSVEYGTTGEPKAGL
ncbi:multidrug ABC transporter ATP-binding protein [Streptomyces spiroverticillatus]